MCWAFITLIFSSFKTNSSFGVHVLREWGLEAYHERPSKPSLRHITYIGKRLTTLCKWWWGQLRIWAYPGVYSSSISIKYLDKSHCENDIQRHLLALHQMKLIFSVRLWPWKVNDEKPLKMLWHCQSTSTSRLRHCILLGRIITI